MFCKNCGSKLGDESLYCSNCGRDQSDTKYLPNEKPVMQRAQQVGAPVKNSAASVSAPQTLTKSYAPPVSTQARQPVTTQPAATQARQPVATRQNAATSCGYVNANDMSSGGFTFLGFLQPFLALILFIAWKDTSPLKARSFYKGFKIWLVLFIVVAAIAAAVVFAIFLFPLLSGAGK